uniref:TIR domain-containing protein n=1 Tax=Candidatus Kentrum sp. TUN TaxID=2126343 RepID=A0A450ZI70_9GAMM|nr:MAG: TIR domain-containing protein [Candidatus Kentron sp. TUN]VFK54812.1 MAG: TIR domain-containing protein [Candidatus Kentron sp. TUN]
MSDFSYDVFLSHSGQDKPRVRRLAERLREAGLAVWFDDWVIKPGNDIFMAMEKGLENARVQVLCLSPAALDSDWVTLERSTALFRDPANTERRFIPLLLTYCELPDTLRRYKYIDFREETVTAFEELLTACGAPTGGKRTLDTAPVSDDKMDSAGRTSAIPPTDLIAQLKTIEDLFVRAHYERAYEQFRELCMDNPDYGDYQPQANAILSRYNALQNQIISGIIPPQQQEITGREIAAAFQTCLQQFKKTNQ